MNEILLQYELIKTTNRLTFDIMYQHDRVTYMGEDDGQYFKFIASNGYEVISRSRMDIQTERIWLLGAKSEGDPRSGTMVFSSNEKRDAAYTQFVQALDEWAAANGGRAQQAQEPVEHPPRVTPEMWMELGKAQALTERSRRTTPQPQPASATVDIKAAAKKLMGWPLPTDFSPDCGISFDGRGPDARGYEKTWPTGTNLLTVAQAEQMLTYALDGSITTSKQPQPAPPVPAPVDELVQALHEISLASQNSMSGKEECGRIARAALQSPAPQTKGQL